MAAVSRCRNAPAAGEAHVSSRAPTHGSGEIRGAPGESVYLKAGALAIETVLVVTQDGMDIVLKVEVGDQAQGSDAASVAGTIAFGVPCERIPGPNDAPYVLILREHEHTQAVTVGANGELWLLIGTDSGIESLTALYYLRIDVSLTPLSSGSKSGGGDGGGASG